MESLTESGGLVGEVGEGVAPAVDESGEGHAGYLEAGAGDGGGGEGEDDLAGDVGEDLESARMYFSMYGDRSLPAVKWLAKVCADEQAKEYVRSRFEEMGDLKTFDSIFIDDGYESRDRRGGKGGRGSGNRKGPGRR